jgi:hypothetical protein
VSERFYVESPNSPFYYWRETGRVAYRTGLTSLYIEVPLLIMLEAPTPIQLPRKCKCRNWEFVAAVGALMANHWSSPAATQARQRQMIDTMAALFVLCEAGVNKWGQIDVDSEPAWLEDPSAESIMQLCSACYSYLYNLPAQLPPESIDIVITNSRARARIYKRGWLRRVCEWLLRPL